MHYYYLFCYFFYHDSYDPKYEYDPEQYLVFIKIIKENGLVVSGEEDKNISDKDPIFWI